MRPTAILAGAAAWFVLGLAAFFLLPEGNTALASLVYLAEAAVLYFASVYVAGRVAKTGGGLNGVLSVPAAWVFITVAQNAAYAAGLTPMDELLFSSDYQPHAIVTAAAFALMFAAAFAGGRRGETDGLGVQYSGS